jgi:predicted  nucleic acid-binding Zn-ribbon protein
MSYSFKLYRLQQIDTNIDQACARLSEIETALSDDAILKNKEAQLQKVSEKLQKIQKNLREIEYEAESVRSKINQSESSLYGGKIHNPKELQDLQNEVNALKRFLHSLEDRQLEAMMTLEEVEKEHQATLNDLEKAKRQWEEQQATLNEERKKILIILERQEQEKSIVSKSIPPNDLELYNRIRSQRNGVAVVKVNDNFCSACGSTLNSSTLQAARFSNQLTRCPSCGRILYAG